MNAMSEERIMLPPLIDRREDIPLLVSHFLRQLNAEHGKRVESISAEAMSELRATLEKPKTTSDPGSAPVPLRGGF